MTQSLQAATKNVKAVWNVPTILIYCDVCIATIGKNLQPGSHFSTQGWKFVLENFQELSGLKYDKVKLKNRWDQMKANWKLWKELKGKETRLGWNSRLETVNATPEWWASKIAINKDYVKFRKKGIHPDIEIKNDIMFGSTIATGDQVYTPTVNNENEIPDDLQAHAESNNQVDECNESRHVEPSSSKTSGKRKCRTTSTVRDDLHSLATSIEQRVAIETKLVDPPGCSIEDIIVDVSSIPEIEADPDLFFFAASIFRDKTNRVMWKAMKTPEKKLGFLKYLYARQGRHLALF